MCPARLELFATYHWVASLGLAVAELVLCPATSALSYQHLAGYTYVLRDASWRVTLEAGLAPVPSGLAAEAAGVQDWVAKKLLLGLCVFCMSLCCWHPLQPFDPPIVGGEVHLGRVLCVFWSHVWWCLLPC